MSLSRKSYPTHELFILLLHFYSSFSVCPKGYLLQVFTIYQHINMLHTISTCYTTYQHATQHINMVQDISTYYNTSKWGTCYTTYQHATIHRSEEHVTRHINIFRNMLHESSSCYTIYYSCQKYPCVTQLLLSLLTQTTHTLSPNMCVIL